MRWRRERCSPLNEENEMDGRVSSRRLLGDVQCDTNSEIFNFLSIKYLKLQK